MKKRAKSKEEERSMEERPCSWSREAKWVKWGRVSLESCFLQHLLVLTSHLHLLVPAIKTRGQLSSTQTHCLSFSHTNFLSSHALAPNMNSSLTQEKKLLNHSMQLSNQCSSQGFKSLPFTDRALSVVRHEYTKTCESFRRRKRVESNIYETVANSQ